MPKIATIHALQTWSKAALREVVFSFVAILRGGWLQSPASDGPPWYGSQRCDFIIIDRYNTYWPSNHSIFVNPAFWIMISASCVGPLKWSAPTFKEQLIQNIILICSRYFLTVLNLVSAVAQQKLLSGIFFVTHQKQKAVCTELYPG